MRVTQESLVQGHGLLSGVFFVTVVSPAEAKKIRLIIPSIVFPGDYLVSYKGLIGFVPRELLAACLPW